MLTRLAVDNFRCLKNVDVSLAPLTVLVGPNDSGKSTFLDAVGCLNENSVHLSESDHWQFDVGNVITATVNEDLRLTKPTRNLVPPKNYQWSNEDLRKRHCPVECLRLPAFDLKMHGAGISDKTKIETIRLNNDGSNIAGMLDLMLRAYRDRFDQLVERLRDLVPGIKNITIRTPDPSTRQVNILSANGLEYSADLASSGVRMLLFFLTLVFRPAAPKTVLLEEPENGIHPKRLCEVMGLLRGLVDGKLGDPVQVIVTTHSPYLLDHVKVEKDQIIVFRREPDGSRTAEPVDLERLRPFLDEFMLGEVWFNETEEGLVAKP